MCTYISDSCYDIEIAYPGNNLNYNPWVPDYKECQKECQLTDGCDFWTYYYPALENDYDCYLKTSQGTPESQELTVSGSKFCQCK